MKTPKILRLLDGLVGLVKRVNVVGVDSLNKNSHFWQQKPRELAVLDIICEGLMWFVSAFELKQMAVVRCVLISCS